MSRYARRKDESHGPIVGAFEALGCSVAVVECAKAGCFDLVVGCCGRSHPVEAKPSKAQTKDKRRLTLRKTQEDFHAAWRGGPIPVVHDAKEVAELVNLWRLEASNADRAALLLKREMDEALRKVNG